MGASDNKLILHPWIATLCILFAFAQGWIILKSYTLFGLALLYLGFAGGIPFILVNGVHGDSGGVAGFVGGILFVLVNATAYYWIIRLAMHFLKRHRP